MSLTKGLEPIKIICPLYEKKGIGKSAACCPDKEYNLYNQNVGILIIKKYKKYNKKLSSPVISNF